MLIPQTFRGTLRRPAVGPDFNLGFSGVGLLLGFCLTLATWTTAHGQEVRAESLTDSTELVFVSQEVGQKLVSTPDDFTKHMQPLERQLRVGGDEPVDEPIYFASMKSGVLDWKEGDLSALTNTIQRLSPKLSGLELPWPKKINLIRVSADVEFGAPHCRAASILLPDEFFAEPEKMETILTHELFHVLSSHNRGLRDELYGIIGFQRCDEIELPGALLGRRLTNPDAPRHEHFIELKFENEMLPAIPVTMMRNEKPQPGGIMGNLDFKLLMLQEQDGKLVPRLKDGKPDLRGPMSTPDFMRKIGRNTGYIIHPEETMADNFWMMVLQSPNIRDTWVTEKLKAVLVKKP
ncbi:MAG: hypothetical protein AB8B50_18490 [Pirellulaceae bacterium]